MKSQSMYPVTLPLIACNRTIHCHSTLWQKSNLDQTQLKRAMESLTDKFVEARELMQDAVWEFITGDRLLD